MRKRQCIAVLLASIMLSNASMTALADEYDLAAGEIVVTVASNGAQMVKHGSNAEVMDYEPVIIQSNNSTSTDHTIQILTPFKGAVLLTIKDINIVCDGDAISVGDSTAGITLVGDNYLYSDQGSAIHVSGGTLLILGDGSLEANIGENNSAKIGSHSNEDFSGNIFITDNAVVSTGDDGEDKYYGDGAGIGSGENGDMTGTIYIDENAVVSVFSDEDGAGIGSGYGGDMTGSIVIGDNAEVIAASGWDGAGIGSGENGDMTGGILIGDYAKVTAWSESEGSGIGVGEGDSDDNTLMKGYIVIKDYAQVIAANDNDGAGIGAGEHGSIAEEGIIGIFNNAVVTAIGDDDAAGIGAGREGEMNGTILISDNAVVTAIGGDNGAAIGTDNSGDMNGTIIITGNAQVTTGMEESVSFDYDAWEIQYELDEDLRGYIGDGQSNHNDTAVGNYIFGPEVSINGIKGNDLEALKDYVNFQYDAATGESENMLQIQVVNAGGKPQVQLSGAGSVEKVLYNNSEEIPTEPGTYDVDAQIKLASGKTVSFKAGTVTIAPQAAAEEDARDLLLKHLKEAKKQGGYQTVTWKQDTALHYDIMRFLQENPMITLEMQCTYMDKEYSFVIPGSEVVADPNIPWYGPMWLASKYSAKTIGADAFRGHGTHVVQKGDTLWGISRKYQISLKDLLSKNTQITSPDLIYCNQEVYY